MATFPCARVTSSISPQLHVVILKHFINFTDHKDSLIFYNFFTILFGNIKNT